MRLRWKCIDLPIVNGIKTIVKPINGPNNFFTRMNIADLKYKDRIAIVNTMVANTVSS